MAYIVVEGANGDEGIGSAFHVGSGAFVTARHVVEAHRIKKVRISEPFRVSTHEQFQGQITEEYDRVIKERLGFTPTWPHYQDSLQIASGPVFHPDDRIDVAAFSVSGLHRDTPAVPLGSHLDDWIHRYGFVLSEAIVMGYPPIPFTLSPHLVATRAEVNAVIDPRDAPKVHFVLSAMPRGGFSGGLAVSEYDFVLGVVTRSLVKDDEAAQLGFFTILSVEPIYECLAAAKLLPEDQKKLWGDFWNTDTRNFTDENGLLVAHVALHDDGKRCYIEIAANDPGLRQKAENTVTLAIGKGIAKLERTERETRFLFDEPDPDTSGKLQKAREGVEAVFRGAALRNAGERNTK